MPIKSRRWNDPGEAEDGLRLLVCRYRPRGVRKVEETWDRWEKNLGPSVELHADYYGKHGPPISWAEYQGRYLAEMKAQEELIGELAGRVSRGETITLLCSSACVDESRCHRSLLRDLIEKQAASESRGKIEATLRTARVVKIEKLAASGSRGKTASSARGRKRTRE